MLRPPEYFPFFAFNRQSLKRDLRPAPCPKLAHRGAGQWLGEADQTRMWNLMIDVVTQSGQFKPNAANLQNDFVVEGEQHYWVHVAIDRFTGRVIDKQIEVVNE